MAPARSALQRAPAGDRLLVVGTSPSAWQRVQLHLSHRNGSRPDVVGFLAQGAAPVDAGWRRLGQIEELDRTLAASHASEVVLCLDGSDWRHTNSLFQICKARGVPVWIPIPLEANGAQEQSGAPTTPRFQHTFKRSLDVAGAISGLLLLGPLLIASAIATLLADGRPLFFRQYRAGLNGRPFRILKVRTMHCEADAQRAGLRGRSERAGQAAFKMKDDPRVTRVGRLLRRTSLDELPQLWNVLLGDMSLVGPRPHPYDDLAGYAPWHLRRLAVKPGMTGLWQVELRNDPDFDRCVGKDLEYIARSSIKLDLHLILRTIPAIFRGTGQ